MYSRWQNDDGFRGKALFVLGIALVVILSQPLRVLAAQPATDPFQKTWQRPDQPVLAGQVSRTWMWGPDAFTDALSEGYQEAPGGQRTVQYFDKSRMELTNPDGDPASPWFVTNGLLVVELMSGLMQTGDNQFEERLPAIVNIAGDADDPAGPTYMTMGRIADADARNEGTTITERLDRSGKVKVDAGLASQGVTAVRYVPETGHTVASPFWAFMNSTDLVYVDEQYQQAPLFPDPFYATGYPVAEAYWAEVKVGGSYRDVLMQCFERRCLTYTPDNPAGWQVEAGNVGRHYYTWRYEQAGGAQPEPTPEPDPSPTPDPEPSPTPDPSPTPEPEPTPDPEPDPLPEALLDYSLAATLGGTQSEYNEVQELAGIATTPDGTVVTVDRVTERVQEFSSSGFWIDGFSGVGEEGGLMETPEDVEVDAEGRIWILDRGNGRIVHYGANGQIIKTIGNVGKPNLRLRDPGGFTIGPDGNFYVADTGNHLVKVYKPDGNFARTIGAPGSGDGQFRLPSDVAVHESGNIIVADQETSRIHMFNAAGEFIFAWGSAGSGEEEFTSPAALEIDAVGRLYIVDLGNHRIQVFTTDAEYIRTIGAEGTEPGQLMNPVDVAADNDGHIYVAGQGDRYVHKFTENGEFIDRWSGDQRANFDSLVGIDVNDAGRVYAADYDDAAVQIFNAEGQFVDLWTSPELTEPTDIAVQGTYVYVLNPDSIVKLTLAGDVVTSWGQSGSDDVEFTGALAIDVDSQGNVYVADSAAYRILKFDANGEFITTWGELGLDPGEFTFASGLAVHNEEVFVLDSYANRVQVFDLDGGYLREWTAADAASERYGIAVDADGYVYLSNYGGETLAEKYTPTGGLVTTITKPETLPFNPSTGSIGIAVNDQNTIYLATFNPNRVALFTAAD